MYYAKADNAGMNGQSARAGVRLNRRGRLPQQVKRQFLQEKVDCMTDT
jgi:hypothetical protein